VLVLRSPSVTCVDLLYIFNNSIYRVVFSKVQLLLRTSFTSISITFFCLRNDNVLFIVIIWAFIPSRSSPICKYLSDTLGLFVCWIFAYSTNFKYTCSTHCSRVQDLIFNFSISALISVISCTFLFFILLIDNNYSFVIPT